MEHGMPQNMMARASGMNIQRKLPHLAFRDLKQRFIVNACFLAGFSPRWQIETVVPPARACEFKN